MDIWTLREHSLLLFGKRYEDVNVLWTFWKNSNIYRMLYDPAEKHNRKCNVFNGYNGNCIGFNGNYNGVYWYVMDSVGGMLNPVGKMPKTH